MSLEFSSRRRNKGKGGAISSDSKQGTGCAVLFGLVFGGAGLAAAFFLGKMFVENVDTYTWDQAPCELLSCEVGIDKADEDSPFSLDVRYRYTAGDSSFEGDRFRLEDYRSDDYSKLARKRQKLLEAGDGEVVAYYDPDEPAFAILERASLWLNGLMLLFPLPFLGIGFGMVYVALASRSSKEEKTAEKKLSQGLSSAAKKSKAGRRVGLVVFTILLLVGIGISFPLAINPIKNSTAAKSWPETPCKVIWSRVRTHEGDDGNTYSVDIFYEYDHAGQTWRSNRYGFIGGSSSGRGGKQEIARQYPRGSTQVCYVNPRDPFMAVLKRELGLGVLLGLIPLVLILAGAIGLLVIVRKSASKRSSAFDRGASTSRDNSSLLRSSADHRQGDGDPKAARVFSPGGKRIVGFFIALGVALFWNGIVSVFLWQLIEGFSKGSPEWFLAIFLIPFVLIGLAMIFAVFYTIMVQFNPKPVLTVTPGSPALGDTLRVEWRLRSGSGRLRNLRLMLIGEEKATYRQGTNTRTESETFYRRVLARAEHGIDIHQGEGRIDLPLDLCPTLDLGNNEIEWSIKIEGEIPRWPDVDDRYVITVRPADS